MATTGDFNLAIDTLGVRLNPMDRAILAHRTGWTGELLSQADLAARLGTTTTAVSKAERDLIDRVKREQGLRLARIQNMEQGVRANAMTIGRVAGKLHRRAYRSNDGTGPSPADFHAAVTTLRAAEKRMKRLVHLDPDEGEP